MIKLALPFIALTACAFDDHDLGVSPPTAPIGATRWAVSLGAPATKDRGTSVAFTPTGDVVVAGVLENATVVSLRAATDGAERWRFALDSASPLDNGPPAIAVDGDGNIYLAGLYEGELAIGATTLVDGALSPFIVKLDPAGNLRWAHGFASTQSILVSLSVTSDGYAYLGGPFGGSIAFPTGTLLAEDYEDAWLAKLDPDGHVLWGRTFDTDARRDGISSLVALPGGGAIVNGYHLREGGDSQWVARFDTTGATSWSIDLGEPGTNRHPGWFAQLDDGRVALSFTAYESGITGTLPGVSILQLDGTVDSSTILGRDALVRRLGQRLDGSLVAITNRDPEFVPDGAPDRGAAFVAVGGPGSSPISTSAANDYCYVADLAVRAVDGAIAVTGGFGAAAEFGNGAPLAAPGGGDMMIVLRDP